MNPAFFQRLEPILAVERLDAYRQDGAASEVALGRYLWNMALCESLYAPLQFVEIALRNGVHASLAARSLSRLAPQTARHFFPPCYSIRAKLIGT